MVNFCNPGVLGTPSEFRRHFEAPILQGREPGSTADEAQLGEERGEELSRIVNAFILRRTNALLSAHLPPKVPSPPNTCHPPKPLLGLLILVPAGITQSLIVCAPTPSSVRTYRQWSPPPRIPAPNLAPDPRTWIFIFGPCLYDSHCVTH